MILYNSNKTDTPFVIKSTWTGGLNQCWEAAISNIYFNSNWWYAGNILVLSCDIEVMEMKTANAAALGNLTWNGGGINGNGAYFWTSYPSGTPFRGYAALSSAQISSNGKYHFYKSLTITDAAINYIKNNNILYQNLSWRLDNVSSGTITISNILLMEKKDFMQTIDKNGNAASPIFIESMSISKIYSESMYFSQFHEI